MRLSSFDSLSAALALAFLLTPPATAQTELPDATIRPVLLQRGDNGGIRLVAPQLAMVTKEVTYTVQVPTTEERTFGGRTIRVTVMRPETRTKTVSYEQLVPQEIAVPAGRFDVRRASGEQIQIINSGARQSRSVPAVAIEVDDLTRPRLADFYQQVLRPETVVVYLLRDGFGPAGPGPGPIGPSPPAPVNGEVALTVENRSGRPVSIYYNDGQQNNDRLVNRNVANRQRMAPETTYPGTRWMAKVNDRMVAEFWVTQAPIATWRIGPPIDFTSWQGAGGDRFERQDDGVWRQFSHTGRLLGKLTEEERTDKWVAMFDGGREMWVRLMQDEALFDIPGSNGWQKLADRAPANGPAPKPNPKPSGDSALSRAEIDALLAVHNQARREVGVPPLAWSDGMAEYAQRWADKLASEDRFDHRQNSPYGENLAIARTARDAAGMWYGEKNRYNGQTMDGRNFMTFGHYTQMVWRNSTRIGCGKATVNGRTIWVCNYDPPGNMIGSKPY